MGFILPNKWFVDCAVSLIQLSSIRFCDWNYKSKISWLKSKQIKWQNVDSGDILFLKGIGDDQVCIGFWYLLMMEVVISFDQKCKKLKGEMKVVISFISELTSELQLCAFPSTHPLNWTHPTFTSTYLQFLASVEFLFYLSCLSILLDDKVNTCIPLRIL